MSLAMFAAPFNESSNNDTNDNLINKKKQGHNKTQKMHTNDTFNSDKVNSVLEQIHNSNKPDEDDDSLGEFNPPPMPESSGVTKTNNTTEHMMNLSNQQNNATFRTLGKTPQPNNDENLNLDLNNYNTNYGNGMTPEEYYKKVMETSNQSPNLYNFTNKPYYNLGESSITNSSQDVLLKKINYMIHLLEENHDEKTNNVTEEVILYSFLGVFIIFIVDSFAKVGKYVR
jgi:hypothetical protein